MRALAAKYDNPNRIKIEVQGAHQQRALAEPGVQHQLHRIGTQRICLAHRITVAKATVADIGSAPNHPRCRLGGSRVGAALRFECHDAMRLNALLPQPTRTPARNGQNGLPRALLAALYAHRMQGWPWRARSWCTGGSVWTAPPTAAVAPRRGDSAEDGWHLFLGAAHV